MVMTDEQATKGQVYEETVRQFLAELEKTQWKIIRHKVALESRALREQLEEEKAIMRDLLEILRREQALIARIDGILDHQASSIASLKQERPAESEEPGLST